MERICVASGGLISRVAIGRAGGMWIRLYIAWSAFAHCSRSRLSSAVTCLAMVSKIWGSVVCIIWLIWETLDNVAWPVAIKMSYMDPMLILCESYETAAFCVVMLRRTESLLKRLASHPQGLGHPLGHPLGPRSLLVHFPQSGASPNPYYWNLWVPTWGNSLRMIHFVEYRWWSN